MNEHKLFLCLVFACLIGMSSHAQWTVGTNVLSTNSLVGIGTSAPAANLDVRGDISNTGSLFCNGDIYISRTTFGYGYVVRPDVDGYRNLQFAAAGGPPLDNLALNSKLTFTTGKFGICNNVPVAQLDVYFPSSSTLQQGLFLHSGSFGTGPNAQASYFIKAQDDGNGAAQFIVHGDGSTGISTDAVPGYKLSVNGSGIFTKVVVKQDIWSDYVFDSSYRLAPLGEVEHYIRYHHHLPEVSSADSVEKNGVDIGGNQAVLLKKIEELTLYVIEQDRKLNEQNRLLLDQRAVSKDLEERLARLEKVKENAPGQLKARALEK